MVDYMKLVDWLDRLPWFVGFFFCGLLVDVLSHGFVLLVYQVGYLVAAWLNDVWFSALVGFVGLLRGLISLVRTQCGWLVA